MNSQISCKAYIRYTAVVLCVFVFNIFPQYDTAEALSTWAGSQKALIRRNMLDMLLKNTRLIYAQDDEQKRLLEQNHANALLLSRGKILVSEDLKKDDLKLLRTIIHEEIEATMQIMAKKDRYRYQGIKELILSQKNVLAAYSHMFQEGEKTELSSDLLLNDILARAFELLVLTQKKLIDDHEMTTEEQRFLNAITPIINANKHNYFTGIFWDWHLRQMNIQIACANGQRFYQAANVSVPEETTDDGDQIVPGKLYSKFKFQERSPLSDPDFLRRWGEKRGYRLGRAAGKRGSDYNISDETFYLYVPKGYDPKNPPGVIVWIPGGDDTGDPSDQWLQIFDKYNLIWIGANNSGNSWSLYKRFGLALDAVHNLKRAIGINEENVYMTGFSGGGRCASMLVSLFAAVPMRDGSVERVFRGGLFMCGVNPPCRLPGKTAKQIKKELKLVFFTGDLDFNLEDTQKTWDIWKKRGFKNMTYIQVPGMEHVGIHRPQVVAYYEQAIRSLLFAGEDKPETPAGGSNKTPEDLNETLKDVLALKEASVKMVAAQRKKTGESLILYADDILENAAVIDLKSTIKNALAAHSVFTGGKIVIFARHEGNAIILNKLIHEANPSLEIITITQKELKELKNTKDQETDQAKALIQYARTKGAKDILALIKGPTDEPENLARMSNEYEIPVIIVGFENAVYSFAEAIIHAMKIRKSQGADGWLCILPPVRTITEDMQKQYEEYLRSLKALVAA